MIRSRGAGVFAPTTVVARATTTTAPDNDDKQKRRSRKPAAVISRLLRWRRLEQQQHERQFSVLLLLLGITSTVAAAIMLLVGINFPQWNHDHDRWLTAQSVSSSTRTSYYSLTTMMTQQQQQSSTSSSSSNGGDVSSLQEEQPCRYDGHCPIGTTCAVAVAAHENENKEHASSSSASASSSLWPGRCRAISIDDTQQQTPTLECVEACRAELQLDEHFYHEAWPDVMKQYATTTQSNTNNNYYDGRPPNGCVLIYQRRADNPEFAQRVHALDKNNDHHPALSDIAPSIQHWTTQTRFRHIVRVDPRLPRDDVDLDETKKNDDNQWMAYCTAPCRDDMDCQPTSSSSFTTAPLPFVCQEGACQRNEQFWEGNKKTPVRRQKQEEQQLAVVGKDDEEELVIVTGADSLYFAGLVNLIKSVQYWAPNVKMVVYNLGKWSPEQVALIRQEPNVISLEWSSTTQSKHGSGGGVGGIPNQFPDHVRQPQFYAWKPIIIKEALTKYKMIFWLDAGSTLTGPITPVIDILKRTGIFLVKGQDIDMTTHSSALTYEWFNYSKASMKTGPHFSGNTQAYLSPSRYVESIVNLNAACALDPDCINPHSATIFNHRYDQTSLSICAYQPHVQAPHYTEYLASSRNQLPAGFPHDEAAFRFVWTSRQRSQDYIPSDFKLLSDSNLDVALKRQERKLRKKNRKKQP